MSEAPALGTRSRRAAVRRERRSRRLRLLAAALAVAAALLALVTWYFAAGSEPEPEPSVGAGRTQRTVLLQLADAAGNGVSGVLLGHDPASSSGAGLLVPAGVLAAAPGSGTRPFGEVLGALGPDASRKALADLVGVTVDGAWALDAGTAGRLVDGLGGIEVDVDVPVVRGATVLLQPGEQRVAGAAAVSYATYLAVAEPEQARLVRLQDVVDGLLAALPRTGTEVTALLDTLGPSSQLTGDVPALADILVGLAADDRSGALQYDTLPVVPVDTGAPRASLRLAQDETRALVDRLFADSVPAAERQGGNRVLVFNGVGTPLLGDRVRDALTPAGLRYVPGGNAETFGVLSSEVQLTDSTPESLALGQRVAQALGLPADAVRVGRPTGVADIVVVVGADFRPGPTSPPG